MTTEHRPPSAAMRSRVSSLEMRLYVATFLAVVYTIAWRAIGGHAPPAPQPATATMPVTTPVMTEPRFVWIDRVPPGLRPAIVLPAGWQLASDPQAYATQPTRVIRAPSRRVPRVRTRSS